MLNHVEEAVRATGAERRRLSESWSSQDGCLGGGLLTWFKGV